MKNTLILAAMPEEVSPLRHLLHDSCYSYERYGDTYFEYTMNLNKGYKVGVLITGVGMINSINSIVSLHNQKRLRDYTNIINVGTVGARGCYKIGDIIKIARCYNGDFDLSLFGYDKYEVPRLGRYLEVGSGDTSCITVSKFLSDSSIIEGFDDYVVDMELYGIASILDILEKKDFSCYKVVTDTSEGEDSKREHENNLDILSCSLCTYVYEKVLIPYIYRVGMIDHC